MFALKEISKKQVFLFICNYRIFLSKQYYSKSNIRKDDAMKLYGGLEAGGTKFVCGVGRDGNLIKKIQFPTTTPEETLLKAAQFFEQFTSEGKLLSLGIGSFGPADLNPKSPKYGYITSTPKKGWKDTPILHYFKEKLKIPVVFETDVGAALYGEWKWGAGKGLKNLIYLTIGTGIGGGIMAEGNIVHGAMHPEMGHIPMASQDSFKGICPYHNTCFEGLASGPALWKRWNTDPKKLPPDHPAWDLEATYISQALATYIAILSPEKIILGGGVMQQKHLFPIIREKVKKILASYIPIPQLKDDNINEYIVPPSLKGESGVIGAISLAEDRS